VSTVVVAVVRNELDILEAFVRYHAELADHLVIADHRSIDGSLELLRELRSEGLPLDVRPLTAPIFRQGLTTTLLARSVAEELRPDLIVPLDADEFLTAERPDRLPELLQGLSRSRPTFVLQLNYVPLPEDELGEGNPVARIVHREPAARSTISGGTRKVIVPAAIAADPAWGIANGNHRVVPRAAQGRIAHERERELIVAHYPVRSVEQLTWRLVSRFGAVAARLERPPKMNAPKRWILGQIADGAALDRQWLTDVALGYASSGARGGGAKLVRLPLHPCPKLRYGNETLVSPIGAFMDTVEGILEARADAITLAEAESRVEELERRLASPARPKPRPSEDQWLLVKGAAGLGNRILALLTAILYADVSGRRLVVDWTDPVYSDDGTNAFPIYFAAPWAAGVDELPDGASVGPLLWRDNLARSVDELRTQASLPKREFNRGSRIDISQANHPEKIVVFWAPTRKVNMLRGILPPELADVPTADLLRETLRSRLPLQPAIAQRIERFRSAHLSGRTVGVHVRYSDKRGDVDALLEKLAQVREVDPELRPFLATDNVDVKERFDRAHPDIVTAPHWYPAPGESAHGNPNAPSRLEQGIEALIDMHLLAGCDQFLFDGDSTFARVAALLRDPVRTSLDASP
jgi:hypothetical protein